MGRCEFRVRGECFLLAALWLLLTPKWVGPMLLAAAVHELGHLLALWAFGVPVVYIEVGAGGARIGTGSMEARQELVCALAGPAAGALLVLCWRWLPRTALLALGHTAFNLLPVYPMDGGRAVQAAKELFKVRRI